MATASQLAHVTDCVIFETSHAHFDLKRGAPVIQWERSAVFASDQKLYTSSGFALYK